MTQDPRTISVVPSASGGLEKTSSEVELSPLVSAALEATAYRGDRVLMVDVDGQQPLGADTGTYKPVILDTPWPGPDPLATEPCDN
ncbi:hypothetical protein AB0H73_10215 [Streptomyces olivoreticuli]